MTAIKVMEEDNQYSHAKMAKSERKCDEVRNKVCKGIIIESKAQKIECFENFNRKYDTKKP